jgi:hypothetical protein
MHHRRCCRHYRRRRRRHRHRHRHHHHHHHHHNLQGLNLLAHSVLKHQAIFFLAFLDHVFLSVENVEFAWKLSLVASSEHIPANFFFL